MTDAVYLQFLRYCLDDSLPLPTSAKNIDWKKMMAWAESQTIVGIIYHGIQRAGKQISMPFDVLMAWIGFAHQIEMRNMLTTSVCMELHEELEKDGFKTCILKGQANHVYYPEGLGNLRTCGDIDIWVVPQNDDKRHPVKRVMEYLEGKNVIESLCYLHAEVKPKRKVPIEVHFHPSFMNEPICNRRFMKLFGDFDQCVCEKEIGDVTLSVLKTEYDVIFQLCHLYRHLIDEGIGLRQFIDYYYLLKSWNSKSQKELEGTLRHLGLWKFAGAVMYVMREVFALPEEEMICRLLEKEGKFLLNEMLVAGNFGHHDPRMAELQYEKGKTTFQVKRAWRRLKRNSRFLQSYPSEVVWEPIARYEHFCWRKLKLWKL